MGNTKTLNITKYIVLASTLINNLIIIIIIQGYLSYCVIHLFLGDKTIRCFFHPTFVWNETNIK